MKMNIVCMTIYSGEPILRDGFTVGDSQVLLSTNFPLIHDEEQERIGVD